MRLAVNGQEVPAEHLSDCLLSLAETAGPEEFVLDIAIPLDEDPRDAVVVRVTRTSPKETIEAAQDCLDELSHPT